MYSMAKKEKGNQRKLEKREWIHNQVTANPFKILSRNERNSKQSFQSRQITKHNL